MLLIPHSPDSCCLCGATDDLTGEHKIKASALKAEFGSNSLAIGHFDEPTRRVRLAQSPRSKAFHFDAPLCRDCNSRRTQAADREFDRFHLTAKALLDAGEDPSRVFEDQRYPVGSEPYLNVFRYFAKLLCCHMAELGAPRRVHVAAFAMGEVEQNCVWLAVDRDWTYEQFSQQLGPHQYAAHGGLVVYGDRRTGNANAFHSSLSIGPLRYVFFSRLIWLERMELRLMHRRFYKWCRAQVAEATTSPMPQTDLLRLGLAADGDAEITSQ